MQEPRVQPIVIVPGWRNSGPGHWQSLWAEQLPGARRVEQDDWDTPRRDAWVGQLARTVTEAAAPAVSAVPEPSTVALGALGLLGAFLAARRKPQA